MLNPYPLELHEGEDKAFALTLFKLDGSPYNLSGVMIKAEVRDVLCNLVMGLIPAIVDPTLGRLTLTANSQGSTGKAGQHFWDLRITGTGIDFLETSSFQIKRAATKVEIQLGGSIFANSSIKAKL